MSEPVVEAVGVYAADGGVVGELTYVVGHLLGRTECSLCDVTHGPLRRKRAWDDMAGRLPVPVRLVHRNETTAAERAACEASGLPVVLGVRADGAHTTLLAPAALRALDGSVDAFDAALRSALAAQVTS
jgi:hypothetical protein